MAVYKFNVILANDNGNPNDVYVNGWHFSTGLGPITADFDNVRDMLKDFYTVAPVGSAISGYMSTVIADSARVVAYNLDDEKPRAPVYESTFAMTGMQGGIPAPYEVALCFSFESGRISGIPQARRRNRVYLGPWSGANMGLDGRPPVNVRDAVIGAGTRLHTASLNSSNWDWRVYSPTNDAAYDVNHIWCDDAWDTQRRRGLAPTTRSQATF